jgi:hypothetical protein
VRFMLGVILIIAGGAALAAGLIDGGFADRDVLLLFLGGAVLLFGLRMLVKGAWTMILLIGAILLLVATPFGLLFN